MCRIVDDFQSVLICNFLDALGVARLTIDVYGHDGCRVRSNCSFNLVGVDIAGGRIDVYKYWFATVPPDAVGGSHKAIGCCDDFSSDAQCLQGCQQRKGSVGEETYIGNSQIFCEFFFQLLVEIAIVGDPFAVPNLLENLVKFVEVRK
ncbi:hypothetical protein EVA_22429 [gut metagenome]|uniref:Uncharacterized protein n=1 Tax=gut metagenome TaxID=749906 RepID=J9F3J1_9ZZZZ